MNDENANIIKLIASNVYIVGTRWKTREADERRLKQTMNSMNDIRTGKFIISDFSPFFSSSWLFQ